MRHDEVPQMADTETERLAALLHDVYEAHAVRVGWQTQESCRVQWRDLPEANRRVMLEVAEVALSELDPRHRDRKEIAALRAQLAETQATLARTLERGLAEENAKEAALSTSASDDPSPATAETEQMLCDECGHPPARGNVVYEDTGRRPLCPKCNQPASPTVADVADITPNTESAREAEYRRGYVAGIENAVLTVRRDVDKLTSWGLEDVIGRQEALDAIRALLPAEPVKEP